MNLHPHQDIETRSATNINLEQLTKMALSDEQDHKVFFANLILFSSNIQNNIPPEEMRKKLRELSEANKGGLSLPLLGLQSVLCASLSTSGMDSNAIEALL
jgi:hypothetical protein